MERETGRGEGVRRRGDELDGHEGVEGGEEEEEEAVGWEGEVLVRGLGGLMGGFF